VPERNTPMQKMMLCGFGVVFWDDGYPRRAVSSDRVDPWGGFNACLFHLTDW
jgi:hypothetical protein